MDAFAENQMGRDQVVVASPFARRRVSKEDSSDFSKKAARKAAEIAQGLLHPTDASEVIEVPNLSVEESGLIAARWNRKQSAFMPVGDPYAEPDTSVPYTKQLAAHYCTSRQAMAVLRRLVLQLFPVIGWMPKTTYSSLTADVIAGFTVGVMLIPQSMSYANIAGLP